MVFSSLTILLLICSCCLSFVSICVCALVVQDTLAGGLVFSCKLLLFACTLTISSRCRQRQCLDTHENSTRDTRIRNPFTPSQISHDLLSVMRLSSTPTTRYLMLKVAYHRPMSSPWVVRGAWAQMNSNTVMETSREERPLKSLEMMNHRQVLFECNSKCLWDHAYIVTKV